MYSGASVIVFLASAALADRLPRFFDRVNTDFDRFLGILLVIAGVFLIAGGWPLLKGAVTR
jgi:threonine/homoserine/homoserine lactone efflux protein